MKEKNLRHVAMGDPQAPFMKVMAVLESYNLLGTNGFLAPDVRLVAIGDCFDWGGPSERVAATQQGHALLTWMSAHAPEQVVLLAGNHDLARVCELWPFTTDEAFATAQAKALHVYSSEPQRQAEFIKEFPFLPDAECIARDFSCFSMAQRLLVEHLIRSRRFRLAHASGNLLLVHAGVTIDDFALLGAAPSDAQSAARVLNDFFDHRVAQWTEGPLNLAPLHQPGTAATGFARGILYHRPAQPQDEPQFTGPPRRRFDPRRLPPFPQAIGHTRDGKMRELLKEWADNEQAADGPLRSLCIDGQTVRYRRGVMKDARLYFLDGGMNHTSTECYELFDLDARAALNPLQT
jgi:hypothetical protein